MVGTPREEVIVKIKLALSREYERYGRLKDKDIQLSDYDIRQQWGRIQRSILKK